MITLTKLSCKRGAPMGRHSEGDINAATVALEWVPFVDGAYDCGGAYFGGGDPIYCAVGYDENGEEQGRTYIRAAGRDAAWSELDLDPEVKLLPETGSIVQQTIDFLREYIADEECDSAIVDTENEIEDLEWWLGDRGLENS